MGDWVCCLGRGEGFAGCGGGGRTAVRPYGGWGRWGWFWGFLVGVQTCLRRGGGRTAVRPYGGWGGGVGWFWGFLVGVRTCLRGRAHGCAPLRGMGAVGVVLGFSVGGQACLRGRAHGCAPLRGRPGWGGVVGGQACLRRGGGRTLCAPTGDGGGGGCLGGWLWGARLCAPVGWGWVIVGGGGCIRRSLGSGCRLAGGVRARILRGGLGARGRLRCRSRCLGRFRR